MSKQFDRLKSVIRIPPQLDYDTFEASFVRDFQRQMAGDSPTLTIDFAATRWADLMEAMCIGVAASQAVNAGKAVTFTLPFDSTESNALKFQTFVQNWYLINAWKRAGANVKEEQRDTISSSRLLPVMDLASTPLSALTQELRSRLKFYFPELPAAQVESLVDAIVFESAENAIIHAYDEPSLGRSVCRIASVRRVQAKAKTRENDYRSFWIRSLQHRYPDTDFLEISVVDGGVGIYRRLHSSHVRHLQRLVPYRDLLTAETSEAKCLLWALSEQRSTHLSGPRRGFGLYRILSHAVDGWAGAFYVRSGGTRIVYLPDSEPAVDSVPPFPGTQIRVFLPLHNRQGYIGEVNVRLAKAQES